MLYCNQVLVLQLGVTCHILFIGIPSSNNIGYAPATICLELRAEIKVTVTPKQYATLRDIKVYPQTKYRISTSNNIGDMLPTQFFYNRGQRSRSQ